MNPAHSCPLFHQPTWQDVQKYINIAYNPHHHVTIPGKDPDEWTKDHSEFFLHVLLPMIRPPFKEWAITVEAILAGEEAISDGSSVILDSAYPWANVKDWMGIAHDYIFRLHRFGLADARGHKWGYFEANWSYAKMHRANGNAISGLIYCGALNLGGWVAWSKKAK